MILGHSWSELGQRASKTRIPTSQSSFTSCRSRTIQEHCINTKGIDAFKKSRLRIIPLDVLLGEPMFMRNIFKIPVNQLLVIAYNYIGLPLLWVPNSHWFQSKHDRNKNWKCHLNGSAYIDKRQRGYLHFKRFSAIPHVSGFSKKISFCVDPFTKIEYAAHT